MCENPTYVPDINKIHGEITQIANQRFTLTTLAITAFITAMGLILPKIENKSLSNLNLVCIFSITFQIFILILYVYYSSLKITMREFSVYLEIELESKWEKHWRDYCDRGHHGYSKIAGCIFVALGFFSFIIPLSYIIFAFKINLTGSVPFYKCEIFNFSLFFMVLFLIFFFVINTITESQIKRIKQKWKLIVDK